MPAADSLADPSFAPLLFAGLALDQQAELLAAGQWQHYRQGEFVYRQGQRACRFYLVAEGEVELRLDQGGGRQLRVGQIGPGGHFGETSLLTGTPNSLSVVALSDLALLVYDEQVFTSLLLANPSIQYQLTISLASRLRLAFVDHASSLAGAGAARATTEHLLDPALIANLQPENPNIFPSDAATRESRLAQSTMYRQISTAVERFAETSDPLLITGETGTGRRAVSSAIHRASSRSSSPYLEVDIRTIDPVQMEIELFGYSPDLQAFSPQGQLGFLEQVQGGTLVLYNAEHLEPDIQRLLASALKKKCFSRVGGQRPVPLPCRLILICRDEPRQKDGHNRLLPTLYAQLARNHFSVSPLREHRRDIPRLVEYYRSRYNRQYGKHIGQIDDQTLGKLMNYDWPGNLTELAGVIQRAVVLARNNEPLSDQILLGVPRPEGKWEFNLLRFPRLRKILNHRLFPALPRAMVGAFFLFVVAMLLFGPTTAEHNIGITLSWVIGWPLMIFAFFFLARTWCSVCGLSVPGGLAQKALKPTRPTPRLIRRHSGWIMATLCIVLFWIETTWNAYDSPRLTAWIIITITTGSLLFSMLYKRRVWCRYLCPLGAINALFSMPSIIELRANTQVCLNRCAEHACYTGDDDAAGCPMFRHPFLVDNNRDCILCGQCVKNCRLNSIHLNLRLAPQELWNQQSPRLADSLLVVSLAAIYFPFAISQNHPAWIGELTAILLPPASPVSIPLVASLVFFGCIAFYLAGYAILSRMMATVTGNSWRAVAAILGYGMIPLVLGAFMAVHLDILIRDLWLLPVNLMELVGLSPPHTPVRALSSDATFILQLLTVTGGLIASLYATRRILRRLAAGRSPRSMLFHLPAMLLGISAALYTLLL